MENLIKNALWNVQKDNAPLYFKETSPIEFDRTQLYDARTCSLSMKDGVASQYFDGFLDVHGKNSLMFGLTVKAAKIDEMFYVIEYFDSKKLPITVGTKNITENITENFTDIFVKAEIPQNTAYIRLRWDFRGNVDKAIFCNPRLFAE